MNFKSYICPKLERIGLNPSLVSTGPLDDMVSQEVWWGGQKVEVCLTPVANLANGRRVIQINCVCLKVDGSQDDLLYKLGWIFIQRNLLASLCKYVALPPTEFTPQAQFMLAVDLLADTLTDEALDAAFVALRDERSDFLRDFYDK